MSLENICALICAYNEEKTIKKIVMDSKKYVRDVIVVDDGSEDSTAKEAVEGGAVFLHHESNLGKGAALKTGFNYILKKDYDAVITLDADGQHLPHEIPLFIEKINEGYDVVVGKRDFRTKTVPFTRKLGNLIDSYMLSKLLKEEIYDAQNGFRIFKRDALIRMNKELGNSDFSYETELLIKMIRNDSKIGWVNISTIYSKDLESKIKPFKHTFQSINLYVRCLRGRI